ncbi:MAG: hypothetical protein ACTSV1_06355 [Alphaproteobacteria bacterium]
MDDRLMKQDILSDVKVVIAEPKASLRKKLSEDVRGLGCRDIIETGNLKDVQQAFQDGGVDILIGETELPEGSLGQLVHDVRHGVIGDNPFILAIAMVSKPDPARVKRAVDCGVDDIIIQPFQPEDLLLRLRKLSRGRKPFVVTSDYIGPDRYTKGNVPGMQIPHIKAPNPLHLRGLGKQSDINMKKAIARVLNQVNEQKVERHAYAIQWLMDRIVAVKAGEMAAEELDMQEQFDRLNRIATDIAHRLTGTGYIHAAEMCLTLENMTSIMKEMPAMVDDDEMELMGKLVHVIKRKCNGNDPIAEATVLKSLAAEPVPAEPAAAEPAEPAAAMAKTDAPAPDVTATV